MFQQKGIDKLNIICRLTGKDPNTQEFGKDLNSAERRANIQIQMAVVFWQVGLIKPIFW